MADLMPILEQEDIVPRRFTGTFTGPLTRAKIVATVATVFPRNVSFLLNNATKTWFVVYELGTDEYWYEELDKAA